MAFRIRNRQTLVWFNDDRILRRFDRAKIGAMRKIGAFIYRRARSSIKERPGISPPGKPPHTHTRALKESIGFAFDKDREELVVGPTGWQRGGPWLLEFGGAITQRDNGRGRRRRMKYRPRPFMGPAFEAELNNAKLMDAWKMVLSKG